MPSQLESLKELLRKMEDEFGPDSPSVQGLRAQIARHERDEWRRANGGWFGPAAGWLQQPNGHGLPLEPLDPAKEESA